MSDLHLNPPMTVKRVHAAHAWILPTAAVLVAALAVGAIEGWLFWDRPITNWLVDNRTEALNTFFRRVSFAGSTPVVFAVSLAAAGLSWRRCRPLAIAILVIAFARPLAEFGLKELVHRDRPVGDRLVVGTGYSFPSGHPLATAASWGMLPLVAALYTTRRLLWWSIAVLVWTLVVVVSVSRVWLGVHWTSDVVAAIALAVLGVAVVERLLVATHRGCGRSTFRTDAPSVELREEAHKA
jgi:undecaprenyl-diphosphatase